MSIETFSHSNAPVNPVRAIQFGVLSPEEIVSLSSKDSTKKGGDDVFPIRSPGLSKGGGPLKGRHREESRCVVNLVYTLF